MGRSRLHLVFAIAHCWQAFFRVGPSRPFEQRRKCLVHDDSDEQHVSSGTRCLHGLQKIRAVSELHRTAGTRMLTQGVRHFSSESPWLCDTLWVAIPLTLVVPS